MDKSKIIDYCKSVFEAYRLGNILPLTSTLENALTSEQDARRTGA